MSPVVELWLLLFAMVIVRGVMKGVCRAFTGEPPVPLPPWPVTLVGLALELALLYGFAYGLVRILGSA